MGSSEFDRGRAFPDADERETDYIGSYNGVVVDNVDPLGRGRVRVRIQGLIDRSAWAWPLSLGGGAPGRGMFHPPPREADVTVWFLEGNVDQPLYAGGFWGRDERPPGPVDVDPKQRHLVPAIETERHMIALDGRGDGVLSIRDKESGARIVISGGRVEIAAGSGSVTISMENGKMSIEATEATIKATSASIDAASISLGGPGSGVARLGDAVQVIIPPGIFHVTNPGPGPPTIPSPTPVVAPGTIITSSVKVRSG